MFKKIIVKAFSYFSKKEVEAKLQKQKQIANIFLENGQIPWSEGYVSHKEESIIASVYSAAVLEKFIKKKVPVNYGYRLDERIVEYPWIFANLKKGKTIFLDAGSTFNFDYLLNNELIENKDKYIYTFFPESKSYNQKKISYVYGDLRDLPFRDNFFEEIVCQSTIEHIDMDNSMYGYDLKSTLELVTNKSYEYLKVIEELLRVLKTNGQLLLTFPYGKFENHGFFQQFDDEMVARIIDKMKDLGCCELTFFKYLAKGWIIASQQECNDAESFNPHTQIGKKDDFAAHSRAICCMKFIQTK
ncbi:methyltransferase domain-containing protein [Flavobacterium soyangense]|uniref:Methyltransferase domain-containing protein n=1 Tax=Flavobacterium soyangense TaxID=2023265 RepID=A0A930XU59_9FLAO|nr:methyltransferase domain-containing protein [Flavobacterium soyangense]MBF2708225.1 methyltransferase domain-containing protein [Flavobacterium soyangense]